MSTTTTQSTPMADQIGIRFLQSSKRRFALNLPYRYEIWTKAKETQSHWIFWTKEVDVNKSQWIESSERFTFHNDTSIAIDELVWFKPIRIKPTVYDLERLDGFYITDSEKNALINTNGFMSKVLVDDLFALQFRLANSIKNFCWLYPTIEDLYKEIDRLHGVETEEQDDGTENIEPRSDGSD